MVLSNLVPRDSLTKFEFSRRSTFRQKLRHFSVGRNNENLREFRIFAIIYAHDCLRKQFFCDFRDSGVTLKFKFRYFSHFLCYLHFGWQKLPFFRKFCEKNQFLKFQKIDVYKKWKFRPGIEIKNLQGIKIFRKAVFLGSRWNHSAPKSEDRAEIAKNSFLRQSWS